jgi:hypothetical protein
MPLLTIILALIVVGILLYLMKYIPMDAVIKNYIRIIVYIVVVIWLLKVFGLWSYLAQIHV